MFVANGVGVSLDAIVLLEDDAWDALMQEVENGHPGEAPEVNAEPSPEVKTEPKLNVVHRIPSFNAGGSTGGYSPPVGDFSDFEEATVSNQDDPLATMVPEDEEVFPEFESETGTESDINPKLTEIWFTPEKPYIDAKVSKSILRLYHPDYEELANTIDPANVVDCGRIGEENLAYIIYKPVQR